MRTCARYLWTCFALAGAAWMWVPEAAFACSKCFGAAADPTIAHGIGMAMLALVGTTGLVGSGIALFFIQMRKRAKLLEPGTYVVTAQGEILYRSEEE